MTRVYAQTAAEMINLWCTKKWPQDKVPGQMASTMANGDIIDAFDHVGHGTHKYIPADRLTTELGEPLGAGVFAYWKMKDESYLLLTCKGPLAWWTGLDSDKAQWGE